MEHGPCPLTLVEDTSADREWAPLHSHPWDELTYLLEGEMEFTVGTVEFLREVARSTPPARPSSAWSRWPAATASGRPSTSRAPERPEGSARPRRRRQRRSLAKEVPGPTGGTAKRSAMVVPRSAKVVRSASRRPEVPPGL